MLGSGRPFLVEIQNARLVPSEVSVKEIERKINSLENNLVSLITSAYLFFFPKFEKQCLSCTNLNDQVKVKNVKVVGSQGWNLMREGEAEKQVNFHILTI